MFDEARGLLVPVPERGPRSTTVALWEGARADASDMLFAAVGADPRLVATACLALARAALTQVALTQVALRGSELPRVMPKALKALAAVDDWIVGGGSLTPLERLELLDGAREAAVREALALADRADEIGGRRYLSSDHRAAWSAGEAASACASTVDFVLHASSDSGAIIARSVAVRAAGSVAAAPDDEKALEVELRRMAPIVRQAIPLSVAACALVKARGPKVAIPTRKPSRRR